MIALILKTMVSVSEIFFAQFVLKMIVLIENDCAHTQNHTKQRPMQPTLIVCSVASLQKWQSELAKHGRDNNDNNGEASSVYVHHGARCAATTSMTLRAHAIVLTSYATLAAPSSHSTVLFDLHWQR